MMPITIVSATQLNEAEFFSKSPLGLSLSQYRDYQVGSRLFFSNSRGLSACYNEAIRAAKNEEEILVFVHDDVLIVDFFWIDKILRGFTRFEVLGLAGNKRREPRQPSWAFVDDTFTWDIASNLSGIVGHGHQFPCQLSIYGAPGQECKLLDGVFLATKKSILTRTQILFDETFDFHFYDMDFCRQAELQRLRMGTIALGIIHASDGAFGTAQWKANYERYLNKWQE